MAARESFRWVVFVVLVWAGTPVARADDAPPAAEDTIPRAQLEQIYRHALEGMYQPSDADKVFAAHQLLEQYFATPHAAERKKRVQDLEASGLDVNLLGRLCRIRMHWPALEPGGVYYV